MRESLGVSNEAGTTRENSWRRFGRVERINNDERGRTKYLKNRRSNKSKKKWMKVIWECVKVRRGVECEYNLSPFACDEGKDK